MKSIGMQAAALWLAAAPLSAQQSTPPAPQAASPAPDAAARPKQITVAAHDCLWELAKTYYGNPYRWKVIYAANRDKIKDPNLIYVGQVLALSDAPAPEIGEVGARPVETGAAVTVPTDNDAGAPAATETAAPVDAPAPSEPAAAAQAPAAMAPEPETDREDLHDKMPVGMTAAYPSMTRVVRPSDWSEDGKITSMSGSRTTAVEGDTVTCKLGKKLSAAPGDKFSLYRKDMSKEGDEDKTATYLQVVGSLQVQKALGKSMYSLLVLQSNDDVQVGDIIKRDGQ